MEENRKNSQEKIEERRLLKLRWLRDCLVEVIKVSNETLKKIESEGLKGRYSCNHDVQKWAERVHRVSYELWLLRDISEILSQEALKPSKKEKPKSRKKAKVKNEK